jgi:hypothetical protein
VAIFMGKKALPVKNINKKSLCRKSTFGDFRSVLNCFGLYFKPIKNSTKGIIFL